MSSTPPVLRPAARAIRRSLLALGCAASVIPAALIAMPALAQGQAASYTIAAGPLAW